MSSVRKISLAGLLCLGVGITLLVVRDLLPSIWSGLWVFFVGTGLVLLVYSVVRAGSR